ncbi:hypothetical protein [Hyphomicrobium sp.]|uniref:hypothetical protein n=1 Tax=Hyphomicrobium sp. TaxID=82 RepID=UPI003F71282A
MTDIMKYLGGTLHRVYDAVVQRPMPWRMIDKLSSLEEAEEAREEQRSQSGIDPLRASGHASNQTSDQPPPTGPPDGGKDR